MGKQSAAGFMDESVSRVRRIAAHHGLDAILARQLVTHTTSEVIFRLLDEPAGGGGGGSAPPPAAQAQEAPVAQAQAVPVLAPPPDLEVPPPAEEAEGRPGRGEAAMIAGGVLFGVGAVVLAITIVGAQMQMGRWSLDRDIGWLYGITAGGLVTIGGLITLIVGAVLNG